MSSMHEYDITWLVEDIEEVKIEREREGEGKEMNEKTDLLQFPVELWLMIFGYVMTPV